MIHRPEQQIQRAIVQHYRHRAAPGVFMFAVPNGGFRRPVEAAIMKATGTVPGVPDTIWIKGGQVYALELKAENGRLTEAQERVLIELREAGAMATHAHGLDEALRVLEGWGLLRGHVDGVRR
jgi:VRR-NUC domain